MDIAHNALRGMYGLTIDGILKLVKKEKDIDLLKLVDITEKHFGDVFKPETFEKARNGALKKDSKWMNFVIKTLKEVDPYVAKMTALNLGYEAGFRGLKKCHESTEKYGCNVPWVMLIDPTSACNLRCTGCWAAEYGHKNNLTFDEIDSIITQAKELGTHFFMYTGGEPLMRKNDIIKICEKHHDCAFHAFTNGTLVDEQFCKEMVRVGNLSLSISLEGFEEVNDSRRGKGDFKKVMEAMDLLNKHGLIYGTSICYTSKNYETVTSDEFLDLIIEKGCRYTWYFHYMPVGNDASVELLPTKEQREYMYKRVREIRGPEGGKPIFAMDFQNDGEYVGGCIAGGRCYLHINSNGDVEPCVFIHYSGANIRDKSLLECLKQPLFMKYKENQPFNENHLRPCPMLENPEYLQKMVNETNAKSTDMLSPESVEHLCDKCLDYAKEWAPPADRLWTEAHGCKSCKECACK